MDVLANWMWQGGAVALAATVILRGSRRMSATTRYNLWWTTMAVVLSLPALAWLAAQGMERGVGSRGPLSAATDVPGVSGPTAGLILPATPEWVEPLLGVLWALWLTVSVARIVSAYVGLRHLRGAARDFPASRELRLPTWVSVRGDGRQAKLTLSNGVRAAAVLGLASPTIAVAPRALDALTDAELDQIVIHEWAHVQRGDAVARLIQRVVAAVAGLHPAIWWIDRQLSLERETACDDWAIRAAGSGRSLAVCLTKLASLPGRETDAVLTPAALVTSDLSIRVTRLLDGSRNTSTRATVGVPLIVTTALAAIAVTVASIELVVTAPLSSAVSVTASKPEPTGENPSPVVTLPEAARAPARVESTSAGGPRRSALSAGRRPTIAAEPVVGQSAAPPTATRRPEVPGREASPTHSIAEAPFDARTPLPGTTTEVPSTQPTVLASDTTMPAESSKPATPWNAAANAGVTVGKGSQKAAVATAGFFTRLSKSISSAF